MQTSFIVIGINSALQFVFYDYYMGIPNSQKNYNEKLYLADKQFFKSKKKIFKRRKACSLEIILKKEEEAENEKKIT